MSTEPEDKPELLPLEQRLAYSEKLFEIIGHIDRVREGACILAKRLIMSAVDEKEQNFAKLLLRQVASHDLSKLRGVEWDYLHKQFKGTPEFDTALKQHHQNNTHHPEFYPDGVKQMSDLDIAEMVCDWRARAIEAGSNLKTFAKEDAIEKYGFSNKSVVYKKIKRFLDLLLDEEIR